MVGAKEGGIMAARRSVPDGESKAQPRVQDGGRPAGQRAGLLAARRGQAPGGRPVERPRLGQEVLRRARPGPDRRGRRGGGAAAAAGRERPADDGAGHFKKSGGVLREGAAVKFAFIKDTLAAEFPVDVACEVLGVSRSGYYARLRRPPGARARRREALAVKLEAAHAEHRGVYGSPRLHAAVVAAGERVSVNTVAKVMRARGIRAKTKKKFVPRTTDSAHAGPVA